MNDNDMTIGELADAAGVTRRAIRFYVQRGLLEAPVGRGRGSKYEPRHLEQLVKIHKLQAAGHSLDTVKRILAGELESTEPQPRRGGQRSRSPLVAELWTRVQLVEGVELHVDMKRYQLEAEQLLEIRKVINATLNIAAGDGRR